MNWQIHVPNIFGIGFNVTFIRFLHLSLSIILNMIILQPVSSSESSSQKLMIIGSMTLLSMQFSLQYSFSILTTCSSAFVHTSFVIFPKAACVSSLTSFNRKVVLFESGRFGALKSDSTHHFFRNACTKSGSLRFSQFSGC